VSRVLVTGSSGQLARAIQATWTGHELLLPPESELDLSDRDSIHRVLAELRPDVVINAGAYTAVDAAEMDEDRALLVNGTAVGWLAEACDGLEALLVQISTDYVFDGMGTRPYREDDPTAPRTAYGRTKRAGELAAMGASHHLVVRTAWLYDAGGKNFLETMLRLGQEGRSLRVVEDQHGTPTSCRALARQLQVAVEGGWRGLVHATCEGQTTWYHFAQAIFRMGGLDVDLAPCATSEYPVPAPRPAYSVLDNTRRQGFGPDLMPPWDTALAEVLAERLSS
jgi:dTDP-4-dehydrorhamnose reductase